MPGYFSWVKSSYEYARDTVYELYEDVGATYTQTRDFIRYMLGSPSVHSSGKQAVVEGLKGAVQVINPDIIPAVVDSEGIRETLGSSAYANLIVFAGAGLAYAILKAQFEMIYPEYESSWSEFIAFDIAISLLAAGFVNSKKIDNWFRGNSIFKTTYDYRVEKAKDKLHPFPEVQDCPHGDISGIQAGLASAGYSLGDSRFIYIVSQQVPYGEIWLYPPLLVYQSGTGLVRIARNKVWTCTADMYDIIGKNIPYAIGQGISVFAMTKLMTWSASLVINYGVNYGVEYFTGIKLPYINLNNYYFQTALASFAHHYHIVSVVLGDKPLPGNRETGFDLFYYSHMVTGSLMKHLGDKVLPRLKNSEVEGGFANKQKLITSYPPIKWAIRTLAPSDLRSLLFPQLNLQKDNKDQKKLPQADQYRSGRFSEFEKRPAFLEYIKFNHDNLQAILKTILDKREDFIISVVNDYKDYIPAYFLGQDKQTMIKLIKQELITDQQIKELQNYLLYVKKVYIDHLPPPIKIDQVPVENKNKVADTLYETAPPQPTKKTVVDDPLTVVFEEQQLKNRLQKVQSGVVNMGQFSIRKTGGQNTPITPQNYPSSSSAANLLPYGDESPILLHKK